MVTPAAMTKQEEIDRKVRAVARRLRPDVVKINYTIKEDWSGDWGIFFRVLLSDEAAEKRLTKTTSTAISKVSEAADFASLGVFPYFDFRSQSEQAVLREEAWD